MMNEQTSELLRGEILKQSKLLSEKHQQGLKRIYANHGDVLNREYSLEETVANMKNENLEHALCLIARTLERRT